MADYFDREVILASARAREGLHEFGDDRLLEPLGVLLSSLAEAPLHEFGARLLRANVIHSLGNRLRQHYWFSQHPEIGDERIAAPLVVVGMMRSGTTLMQRLLAADPANTCTYGWEAMEPAPPPGSDPAETATRIAAAQAREEQAREFAPELFAIHPTYARRAEEEIMFLADAFLSHVPEAYCDLPAYRAWLDEQDFTPAYDNLRRTLQLLQWQKKLRGEHPGRWVLKTPAHLGYLDTLLATFPDAHVIHMHRDPVDTVTSGASLNATLWRMHSPSVDPARVGAQWLERMAWTNTRAMAFRSGPVDGDGRFTDVQFRALTADPLGEAARVYHASGAALPDEAREAMAHWLREDATEARARHAYRPGDFGLSEQTIRDRFRDYRQRFLEHG